MPDKILTEKDRANLQAGLSDLMANWYASLATAETTPMPPPPDPPKPGTAWLSGFSDHAANIQKAAGWRGIPTTYARTWADADTSNMMNLPALDTVTKAGYTGVLDLCIGGPSDWGDAARGGFDDEWRAQCRKIHSLWRGLRRLDIAMGHEFNNVPGYRWGVSANEQGAFRVAWARWHTIVQDELVDKGKNAKVVLSCNSDTNGGWSITNGLPDPSTFDYLGCDYYNFWPSVGDQGAWDKVARATKGDVPRGILSWIEFARRIGKPITFPEWGLAPSGNFPVDVPFFMWAMHSVFKSIAPADPYNPGAGQLAGEAYFNAWEQRGRLFPSAPSAPRALAVYKELWRAA
jgi:hypothetical protein